jgi:hypothetical protein
MTDRSSITPSFVFADGQAPSLEMAGAPHEVIKVLLPAAERWFHRLGREGRIKKGISDGANHPPALSARFLCFADGEQINMMRAMEPEL